MHFHVFTIPEFIACLAVPFALGAATGWGLTRLRYYLKWRKFVRNLEL